MHQARKLIDMAQTCTKRFPDIAALFMDEMANAVLIYDLHPALQFYLYDMVAETFQVFTNRSPTILFVASEIIITSAVIIYGNFRSNLLPMKMSSVSITWPCPCPCSTASTKRKTIRA